MPSWIDPVVVTRINLVILGFLVLMQAQILVMAWISARALRRSEFVGEHGRVHDLLTSDTTPPISVIIPAYNEAAGIADSVRSMAMLHYPRLEIVVVNDGSTDDTVERMIEAFDMVPIDFPYRAAIETAPIRRLYRSRLPLPVVLVDKENGGKGDAINAGVNVARYPYVMATDADMILEPESLLRAIRPVVEDRARTVAVGGNVRPLNGCRVEAGKVVEVRLPRRAIEMVQIVEYIRSFLAARPAWSELGALPIISGAFGLFSRSAVVEVGGFRTHHLGEDMEMTMRLHRYMRRRRRPYRIVYVPDAVAWTEVPTTRQVLRRQRIRWHRGLMQVIWGYRTMLLNPRYGLLGTVVWPSFVAFEFIAPVVEFLGWFLVPASLALGLLSWEFALPLLLIALLLGTLNSLLSLYLDDRFGYYGEAGQTARLLLYSLVEHLGLRQRTVWWRVRAMFWNPRRKVWGDMQRTGVARLAAEGPGSGTVGRGEPQAEDARLPGSIESSASASSTPSAPAASR